MFRRKSSSSIHESRRQFLKIGTCGAMTNTTLLSAMVNMRLTSAAFATASIPTTGYRALVCVFLNGAIDGSQVLTPYGTTANDTEYGYYVSSRTNMSLKRQDFQSEGSADGPTYGFLQPIVDSASGKTFGVHPRFTYLRDLYNSGKATFIANVGSLVEPISNKTQFADPAKKKPIGLFSHPDLQRHWQTAVPTSRNQVKGWGGKMADMLTDPAASGPSRFYSAISLLGSNIWETGDRTVPYAVSAQTATGIGGSVLLSGYAPFPSTEYNGLSRIDKAYSDMQNDLVNQTYVDLLEKTIAANRLDARDAADVYQAALQGVTLPTEVSPGVSALPFDTNGLGAQLATVARTIKARAALGQDPGRQIFMVQVGGWDHHANLLQNQNTMIPGIDRGLKSFHDFLAAEGLLDSVTTFTISDFGRTISSNGIGTDHAWGNNMIVMGGALNTGTVAGQNRIWGTYPQIRLGTNSNIDTSTRGTYIPTTATDRFHAELCQWLGVPNNSGGPLETILPNIRNFYSAGGASSHPIGFLNY
jgi:uncharacterized protein (DUF1501 family)